MMAEYVTAGGALMFPNTSGPVPVKSKTAVPSLWSMVTDSRMGLPSSIWSSATTIPTSGSPCCRLNSLSIPRTAPSAFSCVLSHTLVYGSGFTELNLCNIYGKFKGRISPTSQHCPFHFLLHPTTVHNRVTLKVHHSLYTWSSIMGKWGAVVTILKSNLRVDSRPLSLCSLSHV